MSTWADTPPSDSGWYWHRDRRGNIKVVEVYRRPDGDMIAMLALPMYVDDVAGTWSTRISPPDDH